MLLDLINRDNRELLAIYGPNNLGPYPYANGLKLLADDICEIDPSLDRTALETHLAAMHIFYSWRGANGGGMDYPTRW
jgi:hypothetical protein